VRLFAAAGQEMIVACSFAKNFGLYGERVGVLHVVMSSEGPAAAVASQVFIATNNYCIFGTYSSCEQLQDQITALVLRMELELLLQFSAIRSLRRNG